MLISQRPTLHEEVVSESRSRFTIEPLEPVSVTPLVTRYAVHCCPQFRVQLLPLCALKVSFTSSPPLLVLLKTLRKLF